VLVAVGGFLLVDGLVPSERRQRHNEVAGVLYSFIGPLYAILLAFAVFVVWGYFGTVQSEASTEALQLATLFTTAQGLGGQQGLAVQQAALEYGESVINEEWPALAKGQESPKATEALQSLRARVLAVTPSGDRESDLYMAAVGTVNAVTIARNMRSLDGEEDVPRVLWIGLLVGAVLTIAYSYIFGMESKAIHALMVGVLTVFVIGMLYTIQAINRPYKGDVTVRPAAMEMAVNRMRYLSAQP
jgi:hypothetical protein